MKRYPGLEQPSKPNWEGLVANILRRGTPDRTYHLELFQDDVKIDAKHGFEDTIEDVCELKHTLGERIALLGGIDVDFLCRADEAAIRARGRHTLDVCMPGGAYCLGTGNSVTNYIPLDNYLAMLDEGWLYGN